MDAKKSGRFDINRAAMSVMAAALMLPVITADSAPGGVTNNSGKIPFEQAFFAFEVESPLGSLKEVPIWDEIEQMLDNPYQFALDSSVAGNAQGWPSYRLTQQRRRSFIFRNLAGQPCAPLTTNCNEVALARHIIHPLNYNHSTGEELRLLNIEYEGGPWKVADQLIQCGVGAGCPSGSTNTNRYEFTYRDIEVSPGESRIEDDEASASFNSPMAPDTSTCIVSVDQFFSPGPTPDGSVLVPEGSIICGGDPGEPGYAGFGFLRNPPRVGEQYSTPAFPLRGGGVSNPIAGAGPGTPLPANKRLFDPARGFIQPRVAATGEGGLRKPSLRITSDELGITGTGAAPHYDINSAANLAVDASALLPSNENDYFRGVNRAQKVAARQKAAVLGKALFWDMQVGSDAVQACGTCHFHAGADNRTKNQTNPDVNGGDLTLQVHGGIQNANLTVADFPFQKVPDTSNDPGNANGNVNDVASSMGVRFRTFVDIRPIGGGASQSFGPPDASGVRTLLPDIGNDPAGGQEADPIPLFQGLRRVEPRNTPTLFNAAMNFDNFWDGRARHDFNGGSVFGPTDPQAHVFVCTNPNNNENQCQGANNNFMATRQMIRFVSLASLSTGPALSDFEMSFVGRNWAKLGKKLLQGRHTGNPNNANRVVPLANQLVSTTDSIMGIYSNQGGSACAGLPNEDRSVAGGTAPGKPGLCISYPGLIKRAFYPHLWVTDNKHLKGCYTDGNVAIHPNQCAAGSVAIPVLNAAGTAVVNSTADPFDNYVLSIADGAASSTNRDQFTQMEANMSLFFGLSIQAWGAMLVPDDSPFDRFMDANPDSFATFGESGEPGIAIDLLNCGDINPTTGQPQGEPCFTEVGNFKRDPNLQARIGCSIEGTGNCTVVPQSGTRPAGSTTGGAVDPLMGLDFFLGSNLSLKNPNFRSLRCGECHAGSTLTDHTFEISHQVSFGDRIQEFRTGMPGIELFPEALGRGRVISGFLLEGELQENAQDGIERNVADFCTVEPCVDAYGNPVPGGIVGGFPQGQALFDNGMYNIGVTPIKNDVMRGGKDAFGWPLSLAYLAFKNLCGVDYSPGGDDPTNGFAQPFGPNGVGFPCPTFDPAIDPTGGGLFEHTAQDQQINPGFGEEPENPLLPPYLAKWASNIPVGDESNIDEVFVGINTVMREPMLEGFVDSWGPFNPAAILGESFNNARQIEMAMWPNVNRVNTQGGVKAPPLRHVAETGPYFHNGGQLTLRQVVDFYTRGGDFPKTNSHHRDFLIMNLLVEDEALGGVDPVTGAVEFNTAQREEIIVAVVDFLIELSDERVTHQRAPFDQPEIFAPLDGKAPDNGSLAGAVAAGRPGFLNNIGGNCGGVGGAGPCFQRVPETGAGGTPLPVPMFLGLSKNNRLVGGAATCSVVNNHYCH